MAIIIGDIHGSVEKVVAFLTYKPEEEHIALGDYVDGPEGPKHDLKVLRLLLDSQTILLWGNHELEYLLKSPSTMADDDRNLSDHCIDDPVTQLLEINKERFIAAYAVDGWLCTHAGANENIVTSSDVEIMVGEFNEIAREVLLSNNRQLAEESPLFRIGAGVPSDPSGIFNFRYATEICLAKNIKQIFGHEISWPTPNRNRYSNGKESIALATNYRSCWVFDTSSGKLVELWDEEKP